MKPEYRNPDTHKLDGMCYVASETLYHLLDKNKLQPYIIKYEDGSTHWFLKTEKGIVDLTSGKHGDEIPYHKATKKHFLTKKPSKRTKKALKNIKQKLDHIDIETPNNQT